jgi:hypothetical protein
MSPDVPKAVDHARVHHEPEAIAIFHGATQEWVNDSKGVVGRWPSNPVLYSNALTGPKPATSPHRLDSEVYRVALLFSRVDGSQRLQRIRRDLALVSVAHGRSITA